MSKILAAGLSALMATAACVPDDYKYDWTENFKKKGVLDDATAGTNAYMQTHNLQISDLAPRLSIPWDSSKGDSTGLVTFQAISEENSECGIFDVKYINTDMRNTATARDVELCPEF